MRNVLITSLGLAFTAAVAFATATPASAETAGRCAAEIQQVRAALGSADAAVQQKAASRIQLAQQLCQANNPRAGLKELKVAQKLLGLQAQPEAVAAR